MIRVCMIMLSLVIVTSCGGGGESNLVDSNTGSTALQPQELIQQTQAPIIPAQAQGRVGGIWIGKYEAVQTNFAVNVTGIVSEHGEIFWIYPENGSTSQVSEGTLKLNGNVIQNVGLGVAGRITSQAIPNLRYIHNGSSTITTQLEGTVIESKQLILKESYQGTPIGIFTLRYDDTYSNNSELSRIAGNYQTVNSQGIITSHSISTTGRLTGGNSLDCIYNGRVSLINDFYNLYRVSTVIRNCDALNGNWNGYISLSGGKNNLNSKVTFFLRSTNAVQSYSLDRR